MMNERYIQNEKAPTKKTNPQTAFTMGSHFAIDEGGIICIIRIVKVVKVTDGIIETSKYGTDSLDNRRRP